MRVLFTIAFVGAIVSAKPGHKGPKKDEIEAGGAGSGELDGGFDAPLRGPGERGPKKGPDGEDGDGEGLEAPKRGKGPGGRPRGSGGLEGGESSSSDSDVEAGSGDAAGSGDMEGRPGRKVKGPKGAKGGMKKKKQDGQDGGMVAPDGKKKGPKRGKKEGPKRGEEEVEGQDEGAEGEGADAEGEDVEDATPAEEKPGKGRKGKKGEKKEKKAKKPSGEAAANCRGFTSKADCPTETCTWRMPSNKECKRTKPARKDRQVAEDEIDVCDYEICGPMKQKK